MRKLHGLARSGRIAGITALALLLGVTISFLLPERHTITVNGLGQPITFATTKPELGAALADYGLSVGTHDSVEPPVSTPLAGQRDWQVSIRPAIPVHLTVAGEERTVETSALTVQDMLTELQIELGDKDLLSVPLDSVVSAGMRVLLTRRSEQTITSREEVPYQTLKREDATLRIGETSVVQEGAPGVLEVIRKVYLENGEEVKSELLEEKIITPPIDQVVAYGTLGVVSRGGEEYRYTAELELTATGYTAGKESNPDGNGYTYTGMKAVRGVVAVDPRVIPLYTRLYIEGYGPAIAADIGGAIQGNRIDLCFDSVSEALEWGIRPVKVYVLSD